MSENIYEINFPGKVQQAITELAEKYHLTLSEEDFWDFKKPDPEIVIFKAAKKIMAMEKGVTIKDISKSLETDLKMHPKEANELANDIKKSIHLWVEIIEPEEKVKEVESDQEQIADQEKQEAFARAKEELLRKLRIEHGMSEPEPEEVPNTNVKAVPIADVEDNAKAIQHEQEKDEVVPVENVEEKVVDPYKEQVE